MVELRDALRESRAALMSAGIEDATMEARRLIARAAGIPAERLVSDPQMQLTDEQQASVATWISRRSSGEPLARIASEQSFYGRMFQLSDATA